MVADKRQSISCCFGKTRRKSKSLITFFISVISCGFWLLVWAFLALVKGKEQRVRISIDNGGNVIEEKIKM
ncbi:MAG: hypothetical protein IPP53_12675 [Bacteroidetes bacterium]|nr:hypothetical protein [Bacteroidota bacterium]